jgi:hypothetical protein
MTPGNSKDYSTVLHRLAGLPIGSFAALAHQPLEVLELVPRHLFLDTSHDTPYPGTKVAAVRRGAARQEEHRRPGSDPGAIAQHTLEQSLPMATLNAMISNATGTTRGFDELWTDKANVVNESRKYRLWTEDASQTPAKDRIGFATGIVAFRACVRLRPMLLWLWNRRGGEG